MDQKNYINVAICGAVSVGKSTLLNSIFVANYSKIKLKRCTMVPQIYLETTKLKDIDIEELQRKNNEINEVVLTKSENNIEIKDEDIQEVIHVVPRIHDFAKSPKDVKFRFFDIPGLNDSKTKDIYYNYFNRRFMDFDIIIFVVDIYSGLNTSDEIEILDNIIKNCKKNKDENNVENKLIVLANKCDDLLVDDEGELVLEDDLKEMFEQIEKFVYKKINESYPELWCRILPISCEDSYIYRMYNKNPDYEFESKYYNKFGMNEIGKTKWNRLSQAKKREKVNELLNDLDISAVLCQTGFSQFNKFFTEYIYGKEYSNFLINRINLKVKGINDFNKVDIKDSLLKFNDYYNLIRNYDDSDESLKYFTETFNNYINNYRKTISYLSEDKSLKKYCDNDTNKKYLSDVMVVFNNLHIKLDFLSGELEDLKIENENLLIDFYKKSINKKNINIEKSIEYLTNLFDLKYYKDYTTLLNNLLRNNYINCLNEQDFLDKFNHILDICDSYFLNISIEEKISLIYDYLFNYYVKINRILVRGEYHPNLIKTKNELITYVYLCKCFWSNNILKLDYKFIKLAKIINFIDQYNCYDIYSLDEYIKEYEDDSESSDSDSDSDSVNLDDDLNTDTEEISKQINYIPKNILSIEYYLLDLIKKSNENKRE